MVDGRPLQQADNGQPGLRAEYDPEHHMLYVSLPAHPKTRGSVKHTEEREGGLLYDIGHGGQVLGIEVMLAGPLYIYGNKNTGNSSSVPTIVVRGVSDA